MKSTELRKLLAPFKLLRAKQALSPTYKVLQLGTSLVRACAGFGILEAAADTGIKDVVLVDTAAVLAVVDSLPDGEEVALTADENTLTWKCGSARGRLALASLENPLPEIKRRTSRTAWKVDGILPEALERGALSCGSSVMAAVGLFGMQIKCAKNAKAEGTTVELLSSDNISISVCKFDTETLPWPENVVLSPEAVDMLAALMKQQLGTLEIDETEAYYKAGPYKFLTRTLPQLGENLSAIADAFAEGDTKLNLPKDRVNAFIKRAAAFALENKASQAVLLEARDGQLVLQFDEGTASSEEYYVAEGLAKQGQDFHIKLNAGSLARVLSHSSHVVVDHVERGVLVICGETPEFRYHISGLKE